MRDDNESEMISGLSNELAKRLLEEAEESENSNPEAILSELIMPVLGNVARIAGDVLLAKGKSKTQCRIDVRIDNRRIQIHNGWGDRDDDEGHSSRIDKAQLESYAVDLSKNIETTIQSTMSIYPKAYHKVVLILLAIEKTILSVFLDNPQMETGVKLDIIRHISQNLSNAIVSQGASSAVH